jgi:hypothetical protein
MPVPDFDAARRLLAQLDSTSDAKVRLMLGEHYSRDGEDPLTAFLNAPIYRIVCIANLNAKREDRGDPWTVIQIGSRSVGEKTEAGVLLGFVKALLVDSRGMALSRSSVLLVNSASRSHPACLNFTALGHSAAAKSAPNSPLLGQYDNARSRFGLPS